MTDLYMTRKLEGEYNSRESEVKPVCSAKTDFSCP
jgi:hypothetical protein